jgi:riboflavin biosynthesis pyrimidine reductase
VVRIRQSLRADRVIVDSGGTLNPAVLRQGLVDIVDVVTLPVWSRDGHALDHGRATLGEP